MRLAMIEHDNLPVPCAWTNAGWVPLDAVPHGPWPIDLHTLIEAGPELWAALSRAIEETHAGALPGEPAWALPIAHPRKILCVGLNYRDHAAEGGFDIPKYPPLFMRCATSLVAAGKPLRKPAFSDYFDYEAELAVVIGQRARHLTVDNALDAVFGYTLFNDGSLRNFQKHSPTWTMGKNFDATGALGPAIVTADELMPGAANLAIECRVNGETLQDSRTSQMIFPVAEVLAYITRAMTLEPGDIIALGTPAGVGFARKPAIWLKDGDVCEIEIQNIGVLRNVVREDEAVPEA